MGREGGLYKYRKGGLGFRVIERVYREMGGLGYMVQGEIWGLKRERRWGYKQGWGSNYIEKGSVENKINTLEDDGLKTYLFFSHNMKTRIWNKLRALISHRTIASAKEEVCEDKGFSIIIQDHYYLRIKTQLPQLLKWKEYMAYVVIVLKTWKFK